MKKRRDRGEKNNGCFSALIPYKTLYYYCYRAQRLFWMQIIKFYPKNKITSEHACAQRLVFFNLESSSNF